MKRRSLGRATIALVFATSLLAASCRRDEIETTPAPIARRARLGTLPPLPFHLAQSTLAFRRVYEGVSEALRDDLPAPDVDNERAYRRWVEVHLHDWLDRRGAAIRAATNRARTLSSHGSDQEAGVAHGIVAYLAERTVESLIAAPVPGENTDRERASALRDAWRDSMIPLARTALEQWAQCARTFRLASPEDADWGRRCEDEAEGVSLSDEEDTPAEGSSPEEERDISFE